MLKRALFAGAALVIGAMSLQGAVTPASAGPYVKPKVFVPKPQIRVVRPDLRIRIAPLPRAGDTDETQEQESGPDTQQAAVPLPRDKPQGREAGESQSGFDNAALIPDFAANAERLAELAQIEMFRENIEAMQDLLGIAGLGGTQGIPGLSDWGATSGEDGNPDNLYDPSNFGDLAGHRGGDADLSGAAASDFALGLLGRVSGIGGGEKMGGAVTAPASPGDALGGIASQTATLPRSYDPNSPVVSTTRGGWFERPDGTLRQTTVIRYADGSFTKEIYSIDLDTGRASTLVIVRDADGRVRDRHTEYEGPWDNQSEDPGTGSGDAPETGSGDVGEDEDVAEQQDPDADGGVVVWIPPNCGSARCNGIRDYLRNPKGTILRIVGKGTRVSGDREADPSAGASQLTIDQHGLVVSYGADSGPQRLGGGRVQRFDSGKYIKY